MDEVNTAINDVKPEVAGVPSQNELESLKAGLKAKEDELKKVNASIQGLRGSLQEKDRLLKEQSSVKDDIKALQETQKILASMLAEKGNFSDPENKQDYLKKFEELQKEQESKAKQKQALETLAEKINSYQQKVEALGLTEEDEEYWEIRNLVGTGNPVAFKQADVKLKKIEKSKEKPVETAKPDEKDNKIAELEKQLAQLKSGGLKTEIPPVAGKMSNFQDIERGWLDGKVSFKDYEAARQKR